MKITDFHTHAFPDHMAERALTILQGSTKDVTAQLDGKLSSLIASMDKAGIDRSVICSIATKPSQFESILQWSKDIKSDRIVPLPSVHPEDPQSAQRVRQIAQSGFIGLKLHPYYQTFELDSEIAMPIYEAAAETGLLVLCHTGFDIAFPQDRIADPRRVAKILKLFPDMKFVTSHFLAWADWDEAEKHLLGKPVWTDISFAIEYLGIERTKKFISKHPCEYILFGTDSPWHDQSECIRQFRSLNLPSACEDMILWENAARLLEG